MKNIIPNLKFSNIDDLLSIVHINRISELSYYDRIVTKNDRIHFAQSANNISALSKSYHSLSIGILVHVRYR